MSTIFLKVDETVNGKKGSVYFTIGGRREEVPGVQKIEATRRVSSQTFATIGTTRKQSQLTGLEGSGSMTLNYWLVKRINAMLDEYERTGNFPEWSIMVVNEDVGKTLGTQTVQLFNCKLSGDVPLAKLDATTDDALTIDVSFTFDSSEGLDQFNDPQGVGREG